MSALASQSSSLDHRASFYGPNNHESVANEASDCEEASDMSVNFPNIEGIDWHWGIQSDMLRMTSTTQTSQSDLELKKRNTWN